jgi:hypothetical protein
MSHPITRSVLADPVTNNMLAELRKNVDIFPTIIRDQRIQVLVKAGILEIPPKYLHMFQKK